MMTYLTSFYTVFFWFLCSFLFFGLNGSVLATFLDTRLCLCFGPVQRTCGALGRRTSGDPDHLVARQMHHRGVHQITGGWKDVAEISAGGVGKSILRRCLGWLPLGVGLFHDFARGGSDKCPKFCGLLLVWWTCL